MNDKELFRAVQEIQSLAQEIHKEVEQLNKSTRRFSWKPTIEELIKQGHKWEPWYAWRPVKVHGHWTWLKDIYRLPGNTYVDYDNWSWYYYGTIFDVIKDT